MNLNQTQMTESESDGTGIINTSESEGTGISESDGTGLSFRRKKTRVLSTLLLCLLSNFAWSNELHLFTQKDSLNGLLVTKNKPLRVTGVIDNSTFQGLINVQIADITPLTYIDSANDGTGSSVNSNDDGTGLSVNSNDDGTGLQIMSLDLEQCDIVYIETSQGYHTLQLNKYLIDGVEVGCSR